MTAPDEAVGVAKADPVVEPVVAPTSVEAAEAKVVIAPAAAADETDWKAKAEAAEARAEAYKDIARKHEKRQLEALGFDPETAERIRKEQKAGNGSSSTLDALNERLKSLEDGIATSHAEAEVARAVARHKIDAEYEELLDGLTGDALEARASKIAELQKASAKILAAPSTDGAGRVGTPVSGPPQIASREEYAALSPEERRAARKDGRLNTLLGVTP